MIKILFAEDENNLRVLTAKFLEYQGYSVYRAKDGREALEIFYNKPVDLAILDIMMPNVDGYQVCKEIREINEDLPIIILTAKDTEYDEFEGFSNGADEYITKPFSNRILNSRIEALMKRCGVKKANELKVGDLKIAYREHAVYDSGKRICLTPKEYELLCYMIENSSRALTREQILNAVWGYEYDGDIRTVDSHIKCIRYKAPSAQKHLKTVHKVGYMYEND